MLKVNNGNTRRTSMTLFCYSGILIVNFELISHLSLVFLLLNLNKFFFFFARFRFTVHNNNKRNMWLIKNKTNFLKMESELMFQSLVFNDITYSNLKLIEEGEIEFCLQYELVLTSKHVKTNINGINIEQRFSTLTKDKLKNSSEDSFEMLKKKNYLRYLHRLK